MLHLVCAHLLCTANFKLKVFPSKMFDINYELGKLSLREIKVHCLWSMCAGLLVVI